MVAVVEAQARSRRVGGAVREGEGRPLLAEGGDHRVMGDAAEREDGAQARHRGDGGGEERPAGGDLERQRLVLRRDAADRIADRGIDQREAVVGARRVTAGGEAEGDHACGRGGRRRNPR